MNENRKKLNGRSSRQSRERTELTEKFLKDLEEFLSRDYMLNVVADRISEEYAAAPDDYEPTDEDLEEQAKEEAELRRDIIRSRKYNVFRKFFQEGIELKKDNPGSELFKIAKQLLELLDQAESDISSISRRQLRKYKTDFSIYTQLIDSELTKQNVLKKPAETKKDTTRAKCWRIVKKITGWLFKKTSRLIGAIIVAIIGGLIVAIIVDILADFGWLERIKSFFTR